MKSFSGTGLRALGLRGGCKQGGRNVIKVDGDSCEDYSLSWVALEVRGTFNLSTTGTWNPGIAMLGHLWGPSLGYMYNPN